MHIVCFEITMRLLICFDKNVTSSECPCHHLPRTIGITPKRSLHWRHIGHKGVSIHQLHHCLLNRLFRRRSKKTSKLRGTGLCAGNSPVTGEFPTQMASNAEDISIWWRHHVYVIRSVSHYWATDGLLPNWDKAFLGIISTPLSSQVDHQK